MAASTACFFSSLTVAVPFRMRETVLGDTAAAAATISSVTTPAACEVAVAGERLRRMDGGFIGSA